jgi:hypothetical protein
VVHSAQLWRALSYIRTNCPIALSADGTSYDDAKLSVRVRAIIADRWTEEPLLSAAEIEALAVHYSKRRHSAQLATKTLEMMCPDAAYFDPATNTQHIRFELMPDSALWDYRLLLADGPFDYDAFFHTIAQTPDYQGEFIAFLSVHYPHAVLRRSDGSLCFDPFAITDVVLRHFTAARAPLVVAQ